MPVVGRRTWISRTVLAAATFDMIALGFLAGSLIAVYGGAAAWGLAFRGAGSVMHTSMVNVADTFKECTFA